MPQQAPSEQTGDDPSEPEDREGEAEPRDGPVPTTFPYDRLGEPEQVA